MLRQVPSRNVFGKVQKIRQVRAGQEESETANFPLLPAAEQTEQNGQKQKLHSGGPGIHCR